MNAHTTVHLNLGSLETAGLLRCDHDDGRVSFRLVDSDTQVWVTGTADDFRWFANAMSRCADRAALEDVVL